MKKGIYEDDYLGTASAKDLAGLRGKFHEGAFMPSKPKAQEAYLQTQRRISLKKHEDSQKAHRLKKHEDDGDKYLEALDLYLYYTERLSILYLKCPALQKNNRAECEEMAMEFDRFYSSRLIDLCAQGKFFDVFPGMCIRTLESFEKKMCGHSVEVLILRAVKTELDHLYTLKLKDFNEGVESICSVRIDLCNKRVEVARVTTAKKDEPDERVTPSERVKILISLMYLGRITDKGAAKISSGRRALAGSEESTEPIRLDVGKEIVGRIKSLRRTVEDHLDAWDKTQNMYAELMSSDPQYLRALEKHNGGEMMCDIYFVQTVQKGGLYCHMLNSGIKDAGYVATVPMRSGAIEAAAKKALGCGNKAVIFFRGCHVPPQIRAMEKGPEKRGTIRRDPKSRCGIIVLPTSMDAVKRESLRRTFNNLKKGNTAEDQAVAELDQFLKKIRIPNPFKKVLDIGEDDRRYVIGKITP